MTWIASWCGYLFVLFLDLLPISFNFDDQLIKSLTISWMVCFQNELAEKSVVVKDLEGQIEEDRELLTASNARFESFCISAVFDYI